MSCYISSNNERVYVALESAYGTVPAITGANRIPLVKLTAKQVPEQTARKDKTGSRTFVGLPNTIRKTTSFRTQHVDDGVDGSDRGAEPGSAVSGGDGRDAGVLHRRNGGDGDGPDGDSVHGGARVEPGQAVTFSGEMRFVAAIAEYDDGVSQRAVHEYSDRRGRRWDDDDLCAGGESGEREHFRLLGSVDGGAADSERRGDGQDDRSR